MIPIFQMRKLKAREVKVLLQGHSWDVTEPGIAALAVRPESALRPLTLPVPEPTAVHAQPHSPAWPLEGAIGLCPQFLSYKRSRVCVWG